MKPEEIAARLALRELVYRYAQLADDRAFERIPDVFTGDAELSGPGFSFRGHAELRAGLRQLEQYRATLHAVHNHLVTLADDGDRADGETYCVAHHLYQREGAPRRFDMGIRYQDAYRLEAGRWLISARRLNIIWQQDQPLQQPLETKTPAADR